MDLIPLIYQLFILQLLFLLNPMLAYIVAIYFTDSII